jgi:hypothetical protein
VARFCGKIICWFFVASSTKCQLLGVNVFFHSFERKSQTLKYSDDKKRKKIYDSFDTISGYF